MAGPCGHLAVKVAVAYCRWEIQPVGLVACIWWFRGIVESGGTPLLPRNPQILAQAGSAGVAGAGFLFGDRNQ